MRELVGSGATAAFDQLHAVAIDMVRQADGFVLLVVDKPNTQPVYPPFLITRGWSKDEAIDILHGIKQGIDKHIEDLEKSDQGPPPQPD